MNKSVLLIITGSIAAYKIPDVIRTLRARGVTVNCILSKGGEQFITPLALSSVSGTPTYTELFSLKDETEMGHIRLSREADLIVVAPASANMIAKMAHGMADDLASATLLAGNKPVLLAPAMNTKMWEHPATRRNLAQIQSDDVEVIDPDSGELACGEVGFGRLATLETIVERILAKLSFTTSLKGKKALVTAGPTYEPLDPVRFIGNRSSGKQGIAIAQSLAQAGAEVTLVVGPVSEPIPSGMQVIRIQTAQEMLDACESALPVDIAVFAAAVGDWRAGAVAPQKIKKGAKPPALALVPNPDILHSIATRKKNRPALVVGFAAETENLAKNAAAKREAKGADWLLANDVCEGAVFGSNYTSILFIDAKGVQKWEPASKQETARHLTEKMIAYFGELNDKKSRLKVIASR